MGREKGSAVSSGVDVVQTDVVCVGSGAAGLAAAVSAVDAGSRVVVVEKSAVIGGTLPFGGGNIWIPNNFVLRRNGVEDGREDCLRYMARYSYPHLFRPSDPLLGLAEGDYALLEAIYDSGFRAMDRFQEIGAVDLKEMRLFELDRQTWDYADHFPENKVPAGRTLEPIGGSGWGGSGASLVETMEGWLRERDTLFLTDAPATDIIVEDGRVVGVQILKDGKVQDVRAGKGVIFGTGGFAHNVELIEKHQTFLYGACGIETLTGDFVAMSAKVGAALAYMQNAWRAQVVLEEALQNRALRHCVYVLPGHSMIMVDKRGKRVVNEKRSYNDRGNIHFTFDPTAGDYPNQFLFMLFDQKCIDKNGGNYPIPLSSEGLPDYIIRGSDIHELAVALQARLDALSAHIPHVALDPCFEETLLNTFATYNRFAQDGVDEEFGRGGQGYDREWDPLYSRVRPEYDGNDSPRNTMSPISPSGPYFACILAAGALDTNGGPRINARSEVIRADGKPIPGLYAAGNCAASPSRGAYYGGGGTIGLAMTFGYLAGRNASQS